MKAGQIGNGSVRPFTNTRIENTIRIDVQDRHFLPLELVAAEAPR